MQTTKKKIFAARLNWKKRDFGSHVRIVNRVVRIPFGLFLLSKLSSAGTTCVFSFLPKENDLLVVDTINVTKGL